MEDQPVVIERLLQCFERNDRLDIGRWRPLGGFGSGRPGHDERRGRRGGCRGNRHQDGGRGSSGSRRGGDGRFAPGLALARFLEVGDGLGHLAHHRAEHGEIGFNHVKPPAGVDVGQGIDALTEHRARLGVSGQQARQVLDGPLQPRFGTATQGTLEQQDGNRNEGNGGHERFDRREGQAKIGTGTHPEPGQRNEDVDQALHGDLPQGDSACFP